MDRKTIYSVGISCACFLLLVAMAASFIYKDDATAVNSEVEEKVIYLTFDDGPSKNTQDVLDVLAKYDVKATFFVTGQQSDYLDFIKQEAEAGHAIGVHTYSHDFKEIYADTKAYFADLEKMNDIIKEQTGSESRILRFPGGSSNTVSRKYCQGIMTSLSGMVKEKGYEYIDWNASNGDGDCSGDASAMVQQAIREAKDKDQVMMLMHDGSCNAATAKALPEIIEYFQAAGYVFKPITTDVEVFHHTIAN